MRRKDPTPSSTGRGKSLISIRTGQQQRKVSVCRNTLPRSYSTPTSHNEADTAQSRGYVLRSFSSPEEKKGVHERNIDSFYRPKTHGSRTELDSDLENFEKFEDCFIDIDAEEDSTGPYQSSPERDEPKKVVASIIPGSGLQKISILPIKSRPILYSARDAMKKESGRENRGTSRLNFRPLVLNVPTRHLISDAGRPPPGVEELQTSPQYDEEAAELERELDTAEQHLDKEIAIATEESDADTKNVWRGLKSAQSFTSID